MWETTYRGGAAGGVSSNKYTPLYGPARSKFWMSAVILSPVSENKIFSSDETLWEIILLRFLVDTFAPSVMYVCSILYFRMELGNCTKFHHLSSTQELQHLRTTRRRWRYRRTVFSESSYNKPNKLRLRACQSGSFSCMQALCYFASPALCSRTPALSIRTQTSRAMTHRVSVLTIGTGALPSRDLFSWKQRLEQCLRLIQSVGERMVSRTSRKARLFQYGIEIIQIH